MNGGVGSGPCQARQEHHGLTSYRIENTTADPEHSRDAQDAALISAARSGDSQAVEILYRRHKSVALAFAGTLMRSDHDAQDVLHEAFTKTMNALANGYGPQENFPAYLRTAIKSTAADWWNRYAQEFPMESGRIEAVDRPVLDGPLAGIMEAENNEYILAALQALPARWQQVLWYADVMEEPPRRIAPLLGIKPNAVSSLLLRARAGLRAAYLAAENESLIDHPRGG